MNGKINLTIDCSNLTLPPEFWETFKLKTLDSDTIIDEENKLIGHLDIRNLLIDTVEFEIKSGRWIP